MTLNTLNYGTTRSNLPPPYSNLTTGPDTRYAHASVTQPVSPLFASEDRESKTNKWIGSRIAAIFLTFALTVALCLHSLPLTSCNDPLDSEVRHRIREKWNMEVLEHDRQVAEWEHQKARWRHEEREHAKLLREWEYERIHHLQELKERAAREEDERTRLNLLWGRMEAHQCTTYGTREYTALLMNLPVQWEHRVEACKATALEVHGVPYLPKSCEDKGPGHVVGRWEIDQYEPDCVSYWNWFKDKGCTSPGSGKKLIEHYLENLPKGGDWREFCATTPAHFLEMEFSGAHKCYQYDYGTYGLWEIEDANCH